MHELLLRSAQQACLTTFLEAHANSHRHPLRDGCLGNSAGCALYSQQAVLQRLEVRTSKVPSLGFLDGAEGFQKPFLGSKCILRSLSFRALPRNPFPPKPLLAERKAFVESKSLNTLHSYMQEFSCWQRQIRRTLPNPSPTTVQC